MRDYLSIVLLSLTLLGFSVGCTPKRVGPTAPSGYVFSFQAFPPIVLRNFSGAEQLPGTGKERSARLVVEVRDQQDRPIDGVSVAFEVDPEWANNATIAPLRVSTQDGVAEAHFWSRTIGSIPVRARVENVMYPLTISVNDPDTTSNSEG